MDILPILATLKRHKTASFLIVLQIALTCAIVCNALFLIMQRIDKINEPSGLADQEIVSLRIGAIGPVENQDAQTRADLQALRALPGVKDATLVNQLPFGENMSMSTMRLQQKEDGGGVTASMYNVSEAWLKTLGLRLVAGRDFEAGEYQNLLDLEKSEDASYPAIILNRAMATRMFPKGDALGQVIYGLGEKPIRVVGVVDRLVSPQPGGKDESLNYSMLLPVRETFRGGYFIARTEPGKRDEVLKAAALALDKSGAKRILIESQSLADKRKHYYRQDRSMINLLAAVCLGLLVVTAFGIVGLASFWVQQRTRMIGTRRALGATRGQILRYFQTENFILSTIGIGLGMIAAYGISLLLMKSYELPPLPLAFLPIGAFVLWGLGQLAVLAPARRAAALPPVEALRGA
ncbi:ABC transporter permease [Roseateles oligotrophus]|uniref:ABC transporter permease n=1 Tax=Roseateles oligotrophus TaxID=1769250 RepID=A0ABT2YIN2_9BURK|nr:FtsX-like permease family protein [Roseateles oligotrophus]MCV2369863.1 ABC transporter permease [Roseateles oligotrophus]